MKFYKNIFEKIISLENLFTAFDEFKADKKNRKDVLVFEWELEKNIVELNRTLIYHKYKHGAYSKFRICDSKPRVIHKATVRDRVLHHAAFRILNPLFEPSFISHSFSCRVNKGTHRGIVSSSWMIRRVSQNGTRPCFVQKCDIMKFFNSIDHQILLKIIMRKVKDKNFNWLIEEIVGSFVFKTETQSQLQLFDFRGENREREVAAFGCYGIGIPIGNLTSQLFANVYMNEFDQFVKHKLKVKNYCRYTDDFVIVADNHNCLHNLLPKIESFLSEKLKLKLHPEKVSIRKYQQGVDFLGYVILPHHRVLRAKTRKRIINKLESRVKEFKAGRITEKSLFQSLNSYLGVLSHANSHDTEQELKNQFWFWLKE